LDLQLRNGSANERELEEIEKDVNLIRKLNAEIEQVSTASYTSSSIFKVISANFLAFGPLLIEEAIVIFLS